MKIGSVAKTNKIMSEHNINTKKKFGQNFLVDANTLNSIITAANIKSDETIVEIGAGIGALTELLCENAGHVYSFEIDKDLFGYLEANLDYDNLEFVFEDFLQVDLFSMFSGQNIKVVANLPYYITTPILFKVIDSKVNFYELYVMMQKEVGDRISASPNSKEYNALSVMLQTNYDIDTALNVSRNVFVPKPNVDSVVMRLKKSSMYDIANYEFFNKFVHDCFQMKRKNLRNNLKKYDLVKIEEILATLNLDLKLRAEQISIENFVYITNTYYNEVLNEK